VLNARVKIGVRQNNASSTGAGAHIIPLGPHDFPIQWAIHCFGNDGRRTAAGDFLRNKQMRSEIVRAITKAVALYLVLAALVFVLASTAGCATITTPNGLQIRYVKMPLLDTNVATVYRHEWLDEKNVLHEESLTINANMAAEHQIEALKAGLAAGAAMYGAKAGGGF